MEGIQHYLGVFDTEQLAADEYNEKAAFLGRSSDSTDTHDDYFGVKTASNEPDSTAIKIGLGKTIRDVSELNNELVSSMLRDARDESRIAQLTARMKSLLELQSQYLDLLDDNNVYIQ